MQQRATVNEEPAQASQSSGWKLSKVRRHVKMMSYPEGVSPKHEIPMLLAGPVRISCLKLLVFKPGSFYQVLSFLS